MPMDGNYISFKLQMGGTDENTNDTYSSTVNCAKINFVDASSVTVTTNASMKTSDVILANKDQIVAHTIVKPANKATSANISSMTIESSLWYVDDDDENVDNSYYIYINGQDYADEFDFDGTNMV